MSDRRGPSPPSKPEQSNDDLARENERLRSELERTRKERDDLQTQRERLQREHDRLREKHERLKKQLDAARRAGFRQAAPFSRGEPRTDPKRPGRKPGPEYGRKGHRRKPRRVDERLDAPLPAHCPDCGGDIGEERVEMQYQEDIPPVRPLVRSFEVHIGVCERCQQRVQGRHPLQTSDALGAASVQIGPNAVVLAVFLNKQLGLSYGKIVQLLHERFGLAITRGGLAHALRRAADRAGPSYEALLAVIRGSPSVTPDETGWKVGAQLHWLHAFVAETATVYAIAPGRGYEEAVAVLGEDYAGTLIRDGWAPYRRFTKADHQTCIAHLLRRCRELISDHPRTVLPVRVKDLLQRALALRDRHADGKVSDHGLAVARGRLTEDLVLLLENTQRDPDLERFANHLRNEFEAIFTFLAKPGLDATNWRAEQALRGAVITRKVNGGGNRTWKGAQTQAVLASILRTAGQRGIAPTKIFAPLLRARDPIVAPALRTLGQ